MSIAAAPVLAQVKTPSGFYYAAYAENYLGFLVQRRYRRLPPNPTANSEAAITGAWYEPYLHPFLHPGLVAQAGLKPAVLQQWLADHPGEVFTHMHYSRLCLRWGLNPLDHHVQAYRPLPPYEPDSWFWQTTTPANVVYFTPYTVWNESVRTYYHLQKEVPATDKWLANAGLQWHETEQEGEGTWTGWYTHDWEVACAVAAYAQRPLKASLSQLPVLPVHDVQLYHAPGLLTEERTIALPELAWAMYASAPAVAEPSKVGEPRPYPRLMLSRRGPTGERHLYAEKAVAPTVSLAALTQPEPPWLAPHIAWTSLDTPLPTILEPNGKWQQP